MAAFIPEHALWRVGRKLGRTLYIGDTFVGMMETTSLAGDIADVMNAKNQASLKKAEPIPMILTCPACGERHIDEGEFATRSHHTHSCQSCGLTWRPAIVATCGVQFLPGFKNQKTEPEITVTDTGTGYGPPNPEK